MYYVFIYRIDKYKSQDYAREQEAVEVQAPSEQICAPVATYPALQVKGHEAPLSAPVQLLATALAGVGAALAHGNPGCSKRA